jgi:N4-gp56 family major capsid protein
MYRNFANVRMVDQAAYPGSKVTLFRTGANGLGLAVDPLSEYADPDAVALPGLEDKLDVTVNEYGNSTVVTQRLQRFSWTEINPMQAEYVGRNMRDTVDAIYMNAVYGGGGFLGGGFRQATLTSATGVELTGPGTGALTMADDKMFPAATGHGLISTGKTGGAAAGASTQKLTAAHVRRIVAHFRSLGVRPFADGLYNAFITPEIAIQLREGADLTGWRYPHLDGSANGNIWNGTVGVFEGVRFIEGPQFKGLTKGAKVDKSVNSIINVKPAEAATANILFLGAEGIGDVVVEEPHAVVTPTSDKDGLDVSALRCTTTTLAFWSPLTTPDTNCLEGVTSVAPSSYTRKETDATPSSHDTQQLIHRCLLPTPAAWSSVLDQLRHGRTARHRHPQRGWFIHED